MLFDFFVIYHTFVECKVRNIICNHQISFDFFVINHTFDEYGDKNAGCEARLSFSYIVKGKHY